MRNLAIIVGGIALVAYLFAPAHAADMAWEVPQAQLARMGLAGVQPMSDEEGHQVRGNWSAFGATGFIGIPLSAVGTRLVVPLDWANDKGFPYLGAVILSHSREFSPDAEPIPPGRRVN